MVFMELRLLRGQEEIVWFFFSPLKSLGARVNGEDFVGEYLMTRSNGR